MPTIMADCQEKREETSCFHTGTVSFPCAFICLLASAARFISSVRTGRLLLMARKNMLSPMVAEGSSLTICCTLMLSPFHPLA